MTAQSTIGGEWLVVLLGVVIWGGVGYLFWRVAQRAGYEGWVGLLMLVPLVNFVGPLRVRDK